MQGHFAYSVFLVSALLSLEVDAGGNNVKVHLIPSGTPRGRGWSGHVYSSMKCSQAFGW